MFFGCAIRAIALRGAWYDEFYSFYLVRPDASLADLAPAWLRDNHPPLFYAIAWSWSRLIGLVDPAPAIPALRAVNLVIAAGALGAMIAMARRDRKFARIAPFYAAALAACFSALDRIDQLRSYFASFALVALILPMLLRLLADDDQAPRARPWLLAALAAGLSLHLVTSVIVAGVVGGVILALLAQQRLARAAALIATAALAAIPLVAAMVIQLGTIESNTRVFWIPPGFNAGRWAIEAELRDAALANPVLALAAFCGLAILAREGWKGRSKGDEGTAVLALGGGLIMALALLMAIHLHRPMLITRYLVAVDPVIALITAIAAERALRQFLPTRRVIAELAVLATSGIMLLVHLPATLAQPSWNGTGRAIAAIVRACPETTVHPDMAWNTVPRDTPPRENHDVVPFAYSTVARRFGFLLAPEGSLSTRCPNLFWTEHVADQHPPAELVLGRLIRAGYPLPSGRLVRIGNGWVLITPPQPPRAATP